MERPSSYIPMDRRHAIHWHMPIQNLVQGAALFADISGFTPLTESLLQELGPQRGAEELSRYLNLVYDALIAELHQFGGSVISFSGDAITCWLDGDDGHRATTCAFAMQEVMEQFTAVTTPTGTTFSLAMKTAVAVGTARRFLIGKLDIQRIDVLAGSLLDDLANAEHCAAKGDVVVTAVTANLLGNRAVVKRWDKGEGNGRNSLPPRRRGGRYAILNHLSQAAYPQPWSELPPNTLPKEDVRTWLLPAIYEQLDSGSGEFLAELRPAVALFLRFTGIDYDHDPNAEDKLNQFICAVQTSLHHYESNLLQLTIGDKGSSLYAAFGAPLAHEDDSIRAISAALELQKLSKQYPFISSIEIGISQGRMRTGAYGSHVRRTYGVLGDDVNLAARLMQLAKPDEILVSKAVCAATGDAFSWERFPDTYVKGKSKPIPIFKTIGQHQPRSIRLQKPNYHLPMVGREAELAEIEKAFEPILQGKGKIIHINGEAGIGKSRLVAEIIRHAADKQISGFGGECQSYGTKTSYLVWQRIWQGFFGVMPGHPQAEQRQHLQRQLRQLDKQLVNRAPLLTPALNLQISDNDLTRSFDAKLRKSSLESMLVDCVRARSKENPLMLILEDCHWIDPLSLDLINEIGRSIENSPVLMVIVTRKLKADQRQQLSIENLPYYSQIHLDEFTVAEAEQLIKLKLAQFFQSQQSIPSQFFTNITERAEGNPFYIEELLNYLDIQGIDPTDARALAQFELPSSLHSLILSRIDQLTESQKNTLKVASVIGRLFKAAMLWGAYPQLGGENEVKLDLTELSRLELTPLDRIEPELVYLFKNVITQEVAYESLPFATRAMLHGFIGEHIERTAADSLAQSVDLLAYHYEYSNNEAKKKEYLLKAGEAAQANYANKTAQDYYERLLPLLAPVEQISVMLKLGQLLELVGQWDDALTMYTGAMGKAEKIGEETAVSKCQTALGELYRKRGMYEEAGNWLAQAQTNFEKLNDKVGIGQALHFAGSLAAQQGDLETARIRYEASLDIRRQLQDWSQIGSLLSNLGIVARYQGDYQKARQLHEESLEIRRGLGDKRTIAVSLNNLGNVALDQQDYAEAHGRLEEALLLQREVGDKAYIANSLNNLGNVVRAQGGFETAKQHYRESLRLLQALGDKWSLAYLLQDMGGLAAQEKEGQRAFYLVGAAAKLRESIGTPLSTTEEEKLNQLLAPVLQETEKVVQNEWQTAGMQMTLEEAILFALED